MSRIILLTLLFTLVFSWEDLKQVVRILFFALFRKKDKLKFVSSKADRMVSILVTIATLPISLSILVSSGGSAFTKLLILAVGLLVVSVLSYFSAAFFRAFRAAAPLGGIVAGGFSLMAGSLAETAYLPRKVLTRLALLLSLVFFAGLALKLSVRQENFSTVISERIDALITVLVGALIIRVTIDVLGRYLRLARFTKLFSYYRVVLGMVIIAFLLFS